MTALSKGLSDWARSVDPSIWDPAIIERSGLRLGCYGDRVRLAQSSAADLRAELGPRDGRYDAGVLPPGGRFYFEEVTARALARVAAKPVPTGSVG